MLLIFVCYSLNYTFTDKRAKRLSCKVPHILKNSKILTQSHVYCPLLSTIIVFVLRSVYLMSAGSILRLDPEQACWPTAAGKKNPCSRSSCQRNFPPVASWILFILHVLKARICSTISYKLTVHTNWKTVNDGSSCWGDLWGTWANFTWANKSGYLMLTCYHKNPQTGPPAQQLSEQLVLMCCLVIRWKVRI